MKQLFAAIALLAFVLPAYSQTHPAKRPHILGIDHVCFYTTSPDGVMQLYGGLLGLASAKPVEADGIERYIVGKQWVGFSPAPDPKATDRLNHIAFATNNIGKLREYLIANGVQSQAIEGHSDHSLSFYVIDPEGHRIEFVERGKAKESVPPPGTAVSRHMIHAGFLVYNRDAEDHFYRDLLGFRLYWHGPTAPIGWNIC